MHGRKFFSMLTSEEKSYLKNIYTTPENAASFSSEDKLMRFIRKDGKYNISHGDLQKWLSEQDSYSAHHKIIRNFKRPKVISPHKGYVFDMDTAFYRNLEPYNDGFQYFLLVTDVLSHFV